MIPSQNSTPKANRLHIGFFGRKNAGKSGLINCMTGQNVSIVSPIGGTTTDPTEKAMELLPIGAVNLVDTPGLDDDTPLGKLRIEKTKEVMARTDIAVCVVDAAVGMAETDQLLMEKLKSRHIPFLLVWNKTDLQQQSTMPAEAIPVSTKTGKGIQELKERLGQLYAETIGSQKNAAIFGGILKKNDIVILVTPIDESAPKDRMILPQVQSIRAILDSFAVCITVQPPQLSVVLPLLKKAPRLVVTDSQVFAQVKDIVPSSIPLTSFSILFARYKGVLQQAMAAATALEQLAAGSHILIAEGCTHHRQCGDIGTVKLPQWIEKHTGKQFQYHFASGKSFPENLSAYDWIVHCGGCMRTETEMRYRAASAAAQGIPYTNYGMLIAYLNGILERSLSVVQEMAEIEKKSEKVSF